MIKMSSSQTITPTLLVLSTSKSASPSIEPKVNNTFNQVFKNEVASKTKKAPVEALKNPVPNKSSITPSNSINSTSKDSAPSAPSASSAPPINTTTNTATDTTTSSAPSNSNNKEGQSGSVDQIDEDDNRPEDHKLPDLNDPVSLFNFVNKINELSQASTSIVPLENDDMSKTAELLPTTFISNLDAATLTAPPPALNTSELTPPKQGSEVNAATSTNQESVDGSLPQSRFMSELSTAKDSRLTTLPVENQSQLTSSQTPTTPAVVINNIADTEAKQQATLNQLPTQPGLNDAVNLPLEIPNKPAPPSSESSRITIVNSNANTTADLMPTKSGGIKLDSIDKFQRVLTPPLSSNTETAFSNIDATNSTVLASQNSANNPNNIRAISDKINPPLTPPPSSNSETALGKIDATQS
ncbi:hypothetical protein, partial [Undibacterium sp.]|uniref:hypothetical protein n=1 Tax=Undibacterium sp. TaxID=1914977 RepID=UPI0037532B55